MEVHLTFEYFYMARGFVLKSLESNVERFKLR